MQSRQLGQSDLHITPVTLGAWAIGGLFWGGTNEADSIAAIQKSVDLGVTTIDTAPVYGSGRSEEIVGKAIRKHRDKVQILTKFGLRWDDTEGTHYFDIQDEQGKTVSVHKRSDEQSIIHECEQSLRRLGTDHIDLYQHHWPDDRTPIEETFAAVEKLQRQGKIRYAGACNYSPEQLERARSVMPIVSDQPPYSMVRRDIEADVLPYCREHGLGVVVYSPLQMGLLTGKVTADREFPEGDTRRGNRYFTREFREKVNAFLDEIRPIAEAREATLAQLVIAWTIRQPGITAALVGARNPVQAEENARAGDLQLTDGELQRITQTLEKHNLRPE